MLKRLSLYAVTFTFVFCLLALSIPASIGKMHIYYGPLNMHWPALVCAYIMPCILCFVVFSHCRCKSEFDFYGSAPYKRSDIYFSGVLCALVMSLVSVTVVFFINIFPLAVWNYVKISVDVLIRVYVTALVITASTCACAAVGCSAAQTDMSSAFATVTLVFAPYLVIDSSLGIFDTVADARLGSTQIFDTSILSIPEAIFSLSPGWAGSTIDYPFNADRYITYFTLFVNIVCAIVLFAVGVYVYQRLISSSFLRHTMSFIWTLAVSFYVAEWLYRTVNSINQTNFLLMVGMLIAVLLVYFVIELALGGIRGIKKIGVPFTVTFGTSAVWILFVFTYTEVLR